MASRRTYERTHGRMSARTSSFMQAVQTGEAFSSGRGLSASAEERDSLSNSVSVLDQFADRYNVSRQTALEVGLHGRAGLSWPKLSADFRTSLQRRGVTQENYEQMASASRSQSIGNAVSDLTRASQDYSSSSSGSMSTSADKGARDSVDELERQARSAETFSRAASSYSEAADRTQSQFIDNRVDLSAPFVDWMIDRKGLSASQAAMILNGRETPERSAALRAEFSAQYVNDIVAPQIGANFGRCRSPHLVILGVQKATAEMFTIQCRKSSTIMPRGH